MADIVIVDDHPMFREGLASLIGQFETDRVVASVADPIDIDPIIERSTAPVVLLDLSLSKGFSFAEIERLKATHTNVIVIIISMHDDPAMVEKALNAGADGYTLKQDVFDDLMFAIRAAERGGRFISPTITRARNLFVEPQKSQAGSLPQRQQQICDLLVRGQSNKEIANALNIALPTVKNHISVLFKRFGVSNRLGLVAKLHEEAAGKST